MDIIDSHCHLDFPAFDADREVLLDACAAVGLTAIVVPGVSYAGWPGLTRICAGRPWLYPALGLHPWFLDQHRDEHLSALAAWADRVRPVAIGEIGLDFYDAGADRERQLELFRAQLALAREASLPVILHVRKAHDQVLQQLRRVRMPAGGVAHAFAGSLQQARQYLELGFMLGFGGAVTHERAVRLREVLRALPAEALLLETDAPDMAPAGHRGERNTPLNLPEILRVIAQVRGEDPASLAASTSVNARRLFRLADRTG